MHQDTPAPLSEGSNADDRVSHHWNGRACADRCGVELYGRLFEWLVRELGGAMTAAPPTAAPVPPAPPTRTAAAATTIAEDEDEEDEPPASAAAPARGFLSKQARSRSVLRLSSHVRPPVGGACREWTGVVKGVDTSK